MRSWLTLLALTLAVGGLAAWLFHKPDEPAEADYALAAVKPAEVTRIRLSRPVLGADGARTLEEIAIEKTGGGWRITAPFAARADEAPIERLLSVLEARARVRYAANDLARYGLATPPAVLTANDSTIAYGDINPTTREQYVLAGNQVYVVPLTYGAALPRSVDALLSKALFGPGENQVVRFDLPDFTVALEEGTWAVAPISSEASADERNAWVDAWKNAAALTVARHTSTFPTETAKVTLKDGRTITLGIAQRTPDVVLVREDDGVAYHFFADAGKRLLAPPASKSAEVRK